jgi:2-polyprenyl-6-methoxyphenol hydroxylase-like FAD-dependent oxidoreductase
MRVAINGAGVAGPTVAYWLRRAGHEVTLIELAPRLRSGGYVIDFWGIGYDITERMGLTPRIRSLGYQMREVRLVNRHGRRNGGFKVDVFARLTGDRFTSLPRSDIAATIYDALDDEVETVFGDSVASIEDVGDRVRVGFEHSAAREFDVVIGADGLHSRVRELVFGPAERFEVSLGYHVAAFELQGYPHRDELAYVSHAVPGRQVSRFSMREDKTLFLFVFRDEYLRGLSLEPGQRKAAVSQVFADVGWECPQILQAMQGVNELYLDRVSQIRMPQWSKGRVALIGDAAACVSLMAGEGTGLAIAEGYVLAGELATAGGDHVAALARYEERLRPFLEGKQKSAAKFASSFAPKTGVGIAVRNMVTGLLGIPFIADYVVGRDLRDDIALPDYRF